jgi:hypothetical protein
MKKNEKSVFPYKVYNIYIYIYIYGKNVESYISQVILTTKKIEDGFNYSYE